MIKRWAQWVLRDHTVRLPRFPYVAEFETMKPREQTITFVNVDGKMREAKTEAEYNEMMVALHMRHVESLEKPK